MRANELWCGSCGIISPEHLCSEVRWSSHRLAFDIGPLTTARAEGHPWFGRILLPGGREVKRNGKAVMS
jgi:hypothetical protein